MFGIFALVFVVYNLASVYVPTYHTYVRSCVAKKTGGGGVGGVGWGVGIGFGVSYSLPHELEPTHSLLQARGFGVGTPFRYVPSFVRVSSLLSHY